MMPSLDPSTDAWTSRAVRDVAPLPDFTAAATAVLDHLASAFGLPLWMVTRAAGDDQVVLIATASPYGVAAGDVLCWSDAICARMVRGDGPRVAARVADVPLYAAAPVAQVHRIGVYVGVPLTGPDGELFGTLCGVGPEPADSALADAQPLLELLARLLSSLLAVELAQARRGRAREVEHLGGGEGVPLDRDAWAALLRSERLRCARHATPASVIAVDVGLPPTCGTGRDGDVAGRVLGDRRRPTDVLARTGRASYALLCPETPEAIAQVVATELLLRLQEAGVVAAVGVAGLDPRDGDLVSAWRRAEAALRTDSGAVRDTCAAARRPRRSEHRPGPPVASPLLCSS